MSMQSGDAWVCSRRMRKRREDGRGLLRRDAEGAVGRCGAPRVGCASRGNAVCPATPRRGIRRGDGFGAFASDVDPSDGNVARVSARSCGGRRSWGVPPRHVRQKPQRIRDNEQGRALVQRDRDANPREAEERRGDQESHHAETGP